MGKDKVVCYFLLNSISLLANSIFIYYVGLLLLQGKNGGILCSLVIGMDAFFEVVVGPWLARFIDGISNLKTRLRNSLTIQLFLTLATFIFALFKPHHPLAMILPLALIRFLALIDNQLKSALPLSLDKQGIFPLMQSISLSLFSQRFILMMSSSIAMIFLSFSWFFSCSLTSVTYLLAILALLIILKMIKSENFEKPSTKVEPEAKKSSYSDQQRQKWVQWNCSLVFLSGIAFGSVTLLLTKCMLLSYDDSLFMQVLQGPAPIYIGVFVALILMMLFPSKINPFIKSGKQICLISCFLGIGFFFSAFSPFILRLVLLFILGILNGMGLVGLDAFFQRKIDGENFVKAVAKNQACAKAGALVSLALAGFCIDLKFDPLTLLAISGILGLFFCSLLFFLAGKLENEQTEVLL